MTMTHGRILILLTFINIKFERSSVSEPSSNTLPRLDHEVNLPTKLPLIIAHRGASGIFPAHTLPGYTTAIEQGADVIECDLQLTKDLQFICAHDAWLNSTTDVSEVPNLNSRTSTYTVSDPVKGVHERTDYFSIDFELQELRENVRVVQSFKFRDQKYNGMFKIPTLRETINLVKSANRTIGLYIETKVPEFYNQHPILRAQNVTIEQLAIEVLTKNGYTHKHDPCFLQSFSLESLQRFRHITSLPQVFLYEFLDIPTDDDLAAWSKYLYGIGPWHPTITGVGRGYVGQVTQPSALITRAHHFGLRVHPFTFRSEQHYLSSSYSQDPMKEYALFLQLGADGYFTDFPGTLRTFFDTKIKSESVSDDTNAGNVEVAFVLIVFGILIRSCFPAS